MPVHPIARVPPGGVHKRDVRVRKPARMCGASPGELLPPVAPEEPPAIEDEVCARLEGGRAYVRARVLQPMAVY